MENKKKGIKWKMAKGEKEWRFGSVWGWHEEVDVKRWIKKWGTGFIANDISYC